MMEENSQLQTTANSQGAATRQFKAFVIVAIFSLATIIAGGLFWLFVLGTNTPVGAGWFLFSYAAGLSMIVLPCTLPLAFVIVPLSMGKGFMRGISMAIAFSVGVTITLSMYGILAAVLGNAVVGFSGAEGEVIKNWFYALAGIFAIVFALGNLGFIKVRMPTYSGAAPMFIQKQQEILKALLLGLFLGNIGVGCPHPATPILLTRIAVEGDVFYGWLLFFVHAIGRITPLMLLALLAIAGVNATSALVKHREKIEKATGWGMVFVGAFLLVLGFFTHAWWVNSGTHTLFESVVQEERFTGILSGRLNVEAPHAHGPETGESLFFGLPLWLGNWVLVALWVLPLWWHVVREKKRIRGITDEATRLCEAGILKAKKWFFLALTILLGVLFIHVFPHQFLEHPAPENEEKVSALQISLSTQPSPSLPGIPTRIALSLKDEKGIPLTGLEIEHERLIHMLIISEDFSSLGHIHAEDVGPITPDMLANAVFPMEYTFPKPGKYLVAIDFLHKNHAVSEQLFLETAGARETPVIVKDFSRVKIFDGYTVSLATNPLAPLSGSEVALEYHIEKEGGPVLDLEPYLAAPLHVAAVSADLSYFAHTHGEIHDSQTGMGRHELSSGERFGPDIEAHVVFPFPGLYQVFAEFKHQGKVVVTRFLLEAGRGEEGFEMPVVDEHAH